tara:strand:- start:653 stop:952 length:300 start_codon:yes stop_codon:yes gene_type:complete
MIAVHFKLTVYDETILTTYYLISEQLIEALPKSSYSNLEQYNGKRYYTHFKMSYDLLIMTDDSITFNINQLLNMEHYNFNEEELEEVKEIKLLSWNLLH